MDDEKERRLSDDEKEPTQPVVRRRAGSLDRCTSNGCNILY